MSQAKSIPLGPVVIDVVGTKLDDEDCRRLMHPLTGGDWGYCGGPFRATDGEPDPPTPRSLPFAGSLQVRGEPSSRDELELLLGERNFSLKHGRVYCKRGVVLSDFYEVVRKGALQMRHDRSTHSELHILDGDQRLARA